MELSLKEQRKYKRHLMLDQIGREGQEKIAKANVLVLGAGSIGNPVLLYLSATGIGKIGIVDNDLVTEEDLQRQVIYKENDIGKHKAIIARNHLIEKNSKIVVEIFNTSIGTSNINSIVEGYDLIVATTDHRPTLYLLDTYCKTKDKVLVYGSINGFKGTISVFNYKGGPLFSDFFPKEKESIIQKEPGVYSILPGIAGSLVANEVIKIIVGIGEILSGKVLLFDVLEMRQEIVRFW